MQQYHVFIFLSTCWLDASTVMQVSIAKQLKSILGIEDSTKIGFLVHVSVFCSLVSGGFCLSGICSAVQRVPQ